MRRFTWLALAFCLEALAVGVPNVPQTPGELLSGPNAPQMGRAAVIAYHDGVLFTFPEIAGSPPGDYKVRTWDISNPRNPVITQTLGTTRHGFMAHGFIKTDDRLNSGYTFRVNNQGLAVDAGNFPFPMKGWEHSGMSRPWGVTTYWSYNNTNVPAEIFLNKPYGATPNASFDHLGQTGVIGHPFVLGTTMYYVSDQSRTGVASYDISDPSNPVLLDVLTEGNIGGYWPDPVGINGRLYFFLPERKPSGSYQIVDATDPEDLRLVASVNVEGSLQYAQFQDEHAFSERYKIDMNTFEVVLTLDTPGNNRSGDPIDASQWSLPIGNLLVTGGIRTGGNCDVPGFNSTHCGTGMSIWAHQAAPDTTGPFVGYHAPADGETEFPTTHSIHVLIHETLQSRTINDQTVLLRPVEGQNFGPQVSADLFFASNDILSVVPDQPLATDTTYQVDLVEGGILDAVGNGMQGHSFRFSTGSDISGGGNTRPEVRTVEANPNPVVPGDSFTLTVNAFDADSDSLEYRYDFGDGSGQSPWLNQNQRSHQYSDPGHFIASVQVRDPSGESASGTVGITAFDAPNTGTGVASSQLALSGDQLWVVNPDNDSVTLFNANNGNKLREIRSCADPRSVAVDSADQAWISCHDSDQLIVVNNQGTRVDTIDFAYGAAPFAVVIDRARDRALISLYGSSELVMLDTQNRSELDRTFLGPTPRSIAISEDGSRAYVTRFISPATHGELWEVNIAANALARGRTIELQHQWGTDEEFDGRGVPNYLASIAIAPGGDRAWITGKKDNINRGLYLSGEDLDQDNTVRTTIMQIDLDTATEIYSLRRDLDNSEQPVGIAFSPLGDYAFISLQGNNAVVIVDVLKILTGSNGAASVISRLGVGSGPQGLIYDSDRRRLWVNNFLSRNIEQIELADLLESGTVSFPANRHSKISAERLSATVLNGKQIFYHASDERMSGEGYMSCASCHVDGGHDGQSYDFTGRGEGLRNTTSLRGRAGLGHGLVHWSANFDEIQDFENDIRLAFGGEGFLSEADFNQTSNPLGTPKAGRSMELDALAAYVSSLDLATVPRSPARRADGSMTADAEAGRIVFDQLNCGNCHIGTQLIANADLSLDLRDVGSINGGSGDRLGATLTGIDVPTLHGVWATAPYLHSGAATNLDELFVATGGITLQAESANLAGDFAIQDRDNSLLDNRAVVREGQMVTMRSGATATLNFDGQAGGATLRLRYHANVQNSELTLTVNGSATPLTLPSTTNSANQYTNWSYYSAPVTLRNGPNTIVLRKDNGSIFALDELEIGDLQDDVLAADAHATVVSLDQATRDQLIAYLEQLDGRPATGLQIAITEPADGATINAQFTARGTAPAGSEVWIAIDGSDYQRASGGTEWFRPIDGPSDDRPHILSARVRDPQTTTWREVQHQIWLNGTNPGSSDPTVEVTSPSDGAVITLGQSTTVEIATTGSIAFVECWYETASDPWNFIDRDISPPYQVEFADPPEDTNAIKCRGEDPAENKTPMSRITVQIADSAENSVSITHPGDGATLTLGDTVSVDVSTTGSLAFVDCWYETPSEPWTFIDRDRTSPYELSFSPSAQANVIKCRGEDSAGNRTSMSRVSVQVIDTAEPSVTITSPTQGASLTAGEVKLIEIATTGSLTFVDCWYETPADPWNFIGRDDNAPYQTQLSVPNEVNAIKCRGQDSASNQTAMSRVEVEVTGGIATAVEITNLNEGATLVAGQAVTIEIAATGPVTLVHCWYEQPSDDWTWVGADSNPPFSVEWTDPSADADAVKCRGEDSAGIYTPISRVNLQVN